MTVTDGRGRRVADGGLARWLAAIVPVRLQGEVAIALVTDLHIRKLNRQYRGKADEPPGQSPIGDRPAPAVGHRHDEAATVGIHRTIRTP